MRDPLQTSTEQEKQSGRIPFSQQAWTLFEPRPNLSATDSADNPRAYSETLGEPASAFASGANGSNIVLSKFRHAVVFPASAGAVLNYVGVVLALARPAEIGKQIVAWVAVIMGNLIGLAWRRPQERQCHNPVDAHAYASAIAADRCVRIAAATAAPAEVEDVVGLCSATPSARNTLYSPVSAHGIIRRKRNSLPNLRGVIGLSHWALHSLGGQGWSGGSKRRFQPAFSNTFAAVSK